MSFPFSRALPAPLILLALASCEPPASEVESGTPSDEATASSAIATVHEFHDALASGDSTRALGLLHPDAIIYEAGRPETVAEYRAGHLAADIAFASAVEREVVSEVAVSLGEGVLYMAETRVQGVIREREVDSRGVETVVLMAEGDGWRIRHVHWSSR